MKTVRSHIRNHLEHPPDSCLCRKSKTVNRVRLKLIDIMKEDDDYAPEALEVEA